MIETLTPTDRGHADWTLTYTGKAYYPLNPRIEDVDILDIAHGLSMLCRYAGQVKWYYSVAEHCVHVSHMVPRELALEALLHDATEAYCSDIVRPLKAHLPDYRHYEVLNDATIRAKFGLPFNESPLVKQADTNILLSEAKALLPPIPEGHQWVIDGVLDPSVVIQYWLPPIAEMKFLERFEELTREKN